MIRYLREEREKLKNHQVRSQLVKSQRVKNQPAKRRVMMMILMLNQFWKSAAAVTASAQMNLPKDIHSAFASQSNAELHSLELLH